MSYEKFASCADLEKRTFGFEEGVDYVVLDAKANIVSFSMASAVEAALEQFDAVECCYDECFCGELATV